MIKLTEKPLPAETVAKLAEYQNRIDCANNYEERVRKAKRLFKSYNVKGNRTFDTIKENLTGLCCGAQRCHYCEDSKADEVEHIQPKDWYPELCFVWENYCYACGPCNGPKNNQFAIFKSIDGQKEELKRDKSQLLPPPEGIPILINPRREEPLDFLFLDINSTFFFTPYNNDVSSIDHQRAEYTTKVLGLNSRSYLVKARRSAYKSYRARLTEYIAQKSNGTPQSQLNAIIEGIKEDHHQTVWKEMKRQYISIHELKSLFDQAPEACNW